MKMLMNKKTEQYILLALGVGLLFFEILRIYNYCLTWDEGVTYCIFVEHWFYGYDFWWYAKECFLHPGGSGGNNHLLNTLLIGGLDKITGIRYNEYIIRFPVFCFFILYVVVCIMMFRKQYISFIKSAALLLCYYVNEYFALARGYAIAVAFLLWGIFFLYRWKEKQNLSNVFFSLICFLMAETANTVSLLPIAAIYVSIGIMLIKDGKLFYFIKKYFLGLVILVIGNLLMVVYHFKISQADTNLFCDASGSVWRMLSEYAGMLVPSFLHSLFWIVSLFILGMGIILVPIRKMRIEDYRFTLIWVINLILTYCAVKISGAGFPTGRALVVAYPLYILAMGESVANIWRVFAGKIDHKGYLSAGLMICTFCLLLGNFISQINLETTRDFRVSKDVRTIAYEAYEAGEQYTLEDFGYTMYDGVIFYRGQILYRYGFDILKSD